MKSEAEGILHSIKCSNNHFVDSCYFTAHSDCFYHWLLTDLFSSLPTTTWNSRCLLLFHTFYKLVLSSSILLSLVPASTFFGLPKKSSLNTKQQRWKYSSENVWNKFINVINSIYCWLFTMSILEAIMIGLGENWKWKKKKLNKYQATKWTFALQLFSASTIMKNASEW